MNPKELIQVFEDKFGAGGDLRLFFSPGRVNLIGEHTDYNGGNVFPAALTFGTYAVVRRRSDGVLKFASLNLTDEVERKLDDLTHVPEDGWTNYPKGMIQMLKEAGLTVGGAEFLFWGNIPNGAGLSSSASLEVVTAIAMRGLYGGQASNLELALLAQKAENQFIGVNCGIMDQFAVAMGKKDHAILLDCATLQFKWVPFQVKDYELVIANSNKKRGLADSKYNERRSQCEEALRRVQAHRDLAAWGAMTEAEFERVIPWIVDPILVKRARHAVTENQRTLQAVETLQAGNLLAFGQLMNASHCSLRDDYEVTGIELDALVEAAWAQPGVIGSRMTGAGFGGCTVSLVKRKWVEPFMENVGKLYQKKTGLTPDFYRVAIGDGARELIL
ncbi:galactokinase [Gottschalkiaceae bacterium SANA]|nr:galactokinase [Gottschalkiaceae bacterium SANA]